MDIIFIREGVKGSFKLVSYYLGDIIYIQAARSYYKINMLGGKIITHSHPMSKISVEHADLIKVSRHYIVNIAHIKEIKNKVIVMSNKKELCLSDLYLENLKKKLSIIQ